MIILKIGPFPIDNYVEKWSLGWVQSDMTGVLIRRRNSYRDRYRGKTMWRNREMVAISKPRREVTEKVSPADNLI